MSVLFTAMGTPAPEFEERVVSGRCLRVLRAYTV
jgi:hypothetical protein